MAKAIRPLEPTVTFWGAAQTVTGSMHRLDALGQSLLLDCGLYQGHRAESIVRNREFPFKPAEINAVVLSHAHIDHSGNLPNLVKHGFRGPIYCTPATRALAGVMLGDAAKIHEEDAEYLNRKRAKGEPKIEPLFDGRDVYRTLLQLKAVSYDTPTLIGNGILLCFVDAGHLLGSAMVSLHLDTPTGVKSLTFTGDLGRQGLPILRDPAPIPPADFVISESTYGGIQHEPVEETPERLGEVIRRTVERGGKVLIPAFSVGRTQTILYFLQQLREQGRLPEIPIYVDSPMAIRATEVFEAHPECFDAETLELISKRELFSDRQVHYTEKVHQSVELNSKTEPCIIIAASGMCEAGRILHHLKHHIENPRNTVLIVGFQAENTLGRRIAQRKPEVRILGRMIALKAEVVILNGLSSHADHAELMRMLQPLAETTKQIRLVHGEPDRSAALAEGLRKVGFTDIAIPARGDSQILH